MAKQYVQLTRRSTSKIFRLEDLVSHYNGKDPIRARHTGEELRNGKRFESKSKEDKGQWFLFKGISDQWSIRDRKPVLFGLDDLVEVWM